MLAVDLWWSGLPWDPQAFRNLRNLVTQRFHFTERKLRPRKGGDEKPVVRC